MSWSESICPLGRFALVAAVAVCAGCGFQLRGQATYHFKSIYINAPGSPAFAGELRKAFESNANVQLIEDPVKAEVILDIPLIIDNKDVLSLSSAGRVQEFALEKRVQIRLRNNAGVDWLPPDEIVIRRSYLYDDSERLARSIEESRLLREMQTDAVQQIVRRLQAARNPA